MARISHRRLRCRAAAKLGALARARKRAENMVAATIEQQEGRELEEAYGQDSLGPEPLGVDHRHQKEPLRPVRGQDEQQLEPAYRQPKPRPPLGTEPIAEPKMELEGDTEVTLGVKVEVKIEAETKVEAEIKHEASIKHEVEIKMEDIKMEDMKMEGEIKTESDVKREDDMKMEVKEEVYGGFPGLEYPSEFKWGFDPQIGFGHPVAALLWGHVPHRY